MLGAAGLVPALAAAAAVLWGPEPWRATAATVCATYAAIILSFLGGAWWGIVSSDHPQGAPAVGRLAGVFTMSVLPSLAAWGALLLQRPDGLLALGLLFLVVLPGDFWLSRAGLAPGWWPRLRLPLSLGMAAVALVTGAVMELGRA